jgi:phosphoribosylformylglycinamidine synthase
VPSFRVPVQIIPRAGLLDPQGSAVTGALRTLGFAQVQDVHVGRFIVVQTEAANAADAVNMVTQMCDKLLANPVTEDFVIEVAREIDRVASA